MPGWTVALFIVWAIILIVILVIFARAIHRHSQRTGPNFEAFPLPTPHPFDTSLNHNSVLLYPPSARAAGLTREQVANAAPVRSVPFDATTCTICLDDMKHPQKVREMRVCSHIFHSACIRSWLNRNNSCPNCQRIALEEPGVELEIETVSSKDWRSFGYGQWVGQVGQTGQVGQVAPDRSAMV